MKRLVLALLFACGLAACGGEDNTLKGSMSQAYPLKFDDVKILRGGSQVLVEYLKMENGEVVSYVAKLAVEVGDLQNIAGNEIVLTEKLGNGQPRGTISRKEATETPFEMKIGTVTFNQEPVSGTNLSGKFFTTLVTTDGDRTLNGTFKAEVEAR